MNIIQDGFSTSYSPTICVTHRCNLSCIYCYQKNKSNDRMSLIVGKKCIDDIFSNIPDYIKTIEISFIGGEPLLEMDLIKSLYEYTMKMYPDSRVHFFATTNGTTLTKEDKDWFSKHNKRFILGLSLDGIKQIHNYNRSDSFDLIDIPFFLKNWPAQGPKMTISKKTLDNLAENIIYIHEIGFNEINGVNFAEGDFDWGNRNELKKLSKQLRILLDYYTENYNINPDQMFGKHIKFCASTNIHQYKTCGMGTRTILYDVDGRKFPCSFVTPMTFSSEDLEKINNTDFNNPSIFLDKECHEECYLFPICGTCSGANYLVNGTFSKRIKTRCDMYKLISLYLAEYHMRKILTHRETYQDDTQIYYLIEAIKGIKENYFEDFKDLLYVE